VGTKGRFPAWARRKTALGIAVAMLATVMGAAGSEPEPLPEGMRIRTTGAGEYVMADGRSLYWNDKDVAAGTPTCVEECTATWLPLEVTPGADGVGSWSIAERPDGIRQWVYRGKPLYTYVMDTFPGARLGDGKARIWHLAFEPISVPAAMTLQSTLLGRVLADHRGRSLYTKTDNATTHSGATDAAAGQWEIYAAPWLALERGDVGFKVLADGTRQWTYKGARLFTYAKDTDPQDIRGHGLDGRSAVVLEPGPSLPPWVTVQRTDYGLAYADEQGMTLYAPRDMNQILTAQTCPDECMRELWRPVLAKPGETSMGHWVVVDNAAGQRQWSYEGRLLFSHTRDTKPGDIVGQGHAVGYRIGDGFRIILVDPRLRARG